MIDLQKARRIALEHLKRINAEGHKTVGQQVRLSPSEREILGLGSEEGDAIVAYTLADE